MLHQLLIPLVYLFLAACFAVLWHYNRHIKAAGIWAIGYAFPATGFALEGFLFGRPDAVFLRPIIDICYLLGGLLFTAGLAMRFSGKIPYAMLGWTLAGCVALANWFWLVNGDYSARSEVVSYGSALLTLMGAFYIYPKMHSLVDRALFYSTIIFAVQFALVCFVSVRVVGETMNEQTYNGSLFMDMLNLTMALTSTIVSALLLTNVSIEAIEKLRREADTDSLTDLKNRRAFENKTSAIIAAGSPNSLLVCDIDHFKQVNDKWGHSAGDCVIQGLADILRRNCPQDALIGRIGGEEFAILLPLTNAKEATILAESIRQSFEDFRAQSVCETQSFTASFGATQLNIGESYKVAFLRADEALFAAKADGRNRTVTVTHGAAKRRSKPIFTGKTKAA